MGFSGKSTGSEVKLLNRVQLFATPWTVAYRAPLSMGFSRQEYCIGLPFPPPSDFLDPGIEQVFPSLQADSLSLSQQGSQKQNKKLKKKKLICDKEKKKVSS